MPKIKLSHIVSCSSEDPLHPAENLLHPDPKRTFQCKEKGESSVSVIIQLSKTSQICSIDVGNANSAFMEIFAGRSSSKEENYEILLPMSSFMTPMDAMNQTNANRVRLFTGDDLSSSAKGEKWDRVKIICTQPFNKNIQFGLSFITLNTKNDELQLGKFTIRPESPNLLKPGSLFEKRNTNVSRDTDKTIVQQIRSTDTLAPSTKFNIKLKSNKKKPDPSDDDLKKQMNRNRRDLFYSSSDDDDDSNKKTQIKAVAAVAAKPGTSGTPKRKIDKPVLKKRQKLNTKPFNELLNDVVFTISGFVNPERGNIRQNGINLGAKYRRDWDDTCTHLICAFAKTPKFQQVQGKGKIVKKEWLEDCNTQRKRLPWRRYALDKNDLSKPESEDEICEESTPTNETINNQMSCSDTDEEIDKIMKLQSNETPKNKKQKEDEAFCVETDEESLEKKIKSVSDIPDIFRKEIFYIDLVFDENESELLERLIKSFNGAVTKRLSSIVDFVITTPDEIENVKDRVSDGVKFVTKDWIKECHDQLALVPCEKYLLM